MWCYNVQNSFCSINHSLSNSYFILGCLILLKIRIFTIKISLMYKKENILSPASVINERRLTNSRDVSRNVFGRMIFSSTHNISNPFCQIYYRRRFMKRLYINRLIVVSYERGLPKNLYLHKTNIFFLSYIEN